MKRILDYAYSNLEQAKQLIIQYYNEKKLEKEFYEQIEQSTIQYFEQLEADRRLSIKPLLQEELTHSISVLKSLQDYKPPQEDILLSEYIGVLELFLDTDPALRIDKYQKSWLAEATQTSAKIVLKEYKKVVKKELLQSWQKIIVNNLLKEVVPLPKECIELIKDYDLRISVPTINTHVFTDIVGDYIFVEEADYAPALYDLMK